MARNLYGYKIMKNLLGKFSYNNPDITSFQLINTLTEEVVEPNEMGLKYGETYRINCIPEKFMEVNYLQIGDRVFYNGDTLTYQPGVFPLNSTSLYFDVVTSLEGEDTDISKFTLNENVLVKYTSYDSGTVTIPETYVKDGITYTITEIADNAFEDKSMSKVLIPDTVTKIGAHAFDDCNNLTEVRLPENLQEMGSYAFAYCEKLKEVEIPASLKRLEDHTFFSWGSSLQKVTLHDGLEYIGANCFSYSSITSIVIPDTVTELGGNPFISCDNLTYMILSDNIQKMGGLISTTEELNLSNFTVDTYGNKYIKSNKNDYFYFYKAASLATINIHNDCIVIGQYSVEDNRHTTTRVNIGNKLRIIDDYGLYGLDRVTSFSLPISLRYIGDRGMYTGVFSSLIIPEGVLEIGNAAFEQNSSLTSIQFPSTLQSVGTQLLYNCRNLTTIKVNTNNEIFESPNNQCLMLKESKTLLQGTKSGYIPDDTKIIGEYAFGYMYNTSNFIIPEGTLEIRKGAFGNTAIRTLHIPASVTYLEDIWFSNGHGQSDPIDMVYPLTVDPANERYSDGGGLNLIIDKETKSVIITCFKSTIIPEGVVEIADGAYNYDNKIPSLHIPSTVTTIGSSAISDCTAMRTITCLAYNPPNVGTFGLSDFTKNVLTVYVPYDRIGTYESNSKWGALKTTYGATFKEYTTDPSKFSFEGNKLVSYIGNDTIVVIPRTYSLDSNSQPIAGATYAITEIAESAFMGTNVEKVAILDNITTFGDNIFKDCVNLKEATLPSNISTIPNGMFNNTGFTYFNIPSNITNIGNGAFESCDELTSMNIPNTVLSISNNAFKNCTKLETVTLYTNLTTIGDNAFDSCIALKKISIPSTVTQIGTAAFKDCLALNDIDILSNSVTIGENAFQNIPATELYLIGTEVATLVNANAISDNTTTVIVTPDLVDSYLQNNIWNSLSVTSGGRLTITGYEVLPFTFSGQTINAYTGTDETVIVPSSYKNINGLYIKGNTTEVKFMNTNTFRNNTTIKNVTLPDTINTVTGFYGTTNLVSVNIPASCTTIGFDAFDRSGITSLDLSTATNLTTIQNYAFRYCSKLESLSIPNTVTNLYANSLFQGCSALNSVVLPDSITSISPSMFVDCKSLPSVVIPNNVTQISSTAFANCILLNNVIIPENVTRIDNYAFDKCSALTTITLKTSTPPTISTNTFRNTALTTIYIPSGSLSTYESANYWSIYSGKFVEIGTSQDSGDGDVELPIRPTVPDDEF